MTAIEVFEWVLMFLFAGFGICALVIFADLAWLAIKEDKE